MKLLTLVAIMYAFYAAPLLAESDPMASFYGNTIVSTSGSTTIRMHYRADHSFDFTGSMLFISKSFRGSWVLDGKGDVCRTYAGDLPPDTVNPQCVPITSHNVGDVWKSPDNSRTYSLKAGVH